MKFYNLEQPNIFYYKTKVRFVNGEYETSVKEIAIELSKKDNIRFDEKELDELLKENKTKSKKKVEVD